MEIYTKDAVMHLLTVMGPDSIPKGLKPARASLSLTPMLMWPASVIVTPPF